MQTNAHNRLASGLLPEVVGENRETGPDRGILGASCQHSTQTELAFEHADRRFDTAAKRCSCRNHFVRWCLFSAGVRRPTFGIPTFSIPALPRAVTFSAL